MALPIPREQPQQPLLRTPRLWLRQIAATDAPALHALFGDAETMRWNEFPATRDLAETAKRVELFLIPMPLWQANWVLAVAPADPAIGLVCYHHRETWNGRLEVGFMLARSHWGRGLTYEAMTGLLAHCFRSLQINRAEITVNPENKAAIRVTERLGFRREGDPLRQRQRVGDAYCDQLLYGLLRAEWAASLPSPLVGQVGGYSG
jgi:[ribosomal protein S5]-alanine N-acetyltransferase